MSPASAPAFEGVYGRVYDQVIQRRPLRRLAFSLWGSATPLVQLDAFVADAVDAARLAGDAGLLLDAPSGGGTLLPFLARDGFAGTVVEVDLATTMLRRAVALHRQATPDLDTVFLRGDALDLPLADAVADVAVSINGLHVMGDHARFLAELARVTRPGGLLFLITPLSSRSIRGKLILAVAQRTGIIPRPPPSAARLGQLLAETGWRPCRSYGGKSITGVACERV